MKDEEIKYKIIEILHEFQKEWNSGDWFPLQRRGMKARYAGEIMEVIKRGESQQ